MGTGLHSVSSKWGLSSSRNAACLFLFPKWGLGEIWKSEESIHILVQKSPIYNKIKIINKLNHAPIADSQMNLILTLKTVIKRAKSSRNWSPPLIRTTKSYLLCWKILPRCLRHLEILQGHSLLLNSHLFSSFPFNSICLLLFPSLQDILLLFHRDPFTSSQLLQWHPDIYSHLRLGSRKES